MPCAGPEVYVALHNFLARLFKSGSLNHNVKVTVPCPDGSGGTEDVEFEIEFHLAGDLKFVREAVGMTPPQANLCCHWCLCAPFVAAPFRTQRECGAALSLFRDALEPIKQAHGDVDSLKKILKNFSGTDTMKEAQLGLLKDSEEALEKCYQARSSCTQCVHKATAHCRRSVPDTGSI